MKNNRKKIMALILVAMTATSVMTACGKKTDDTKKSNTNTNSFAGYPIQTDKTLKIWASGLNLQKEFTSKDQSPFHTGLEKNTGVKLEWTWPATGTDSTQAFNLMIAAGDLPDIIFHNWGNINGGPDGYIKDKYIVSLNDTLAQNAPNLYKYLQSNKDVDKAVKTDAGTYYAFPWLRGDKWLGVFRGTAARKDWMDELGIKTPETIADWDNMLRVFKEKKGSVLSYPDGWNTEIFFGAYGVSRTFFQDNGKVKYGPAEKAYKDYLTQMNKWYKDGLIDRDFATIDQNGLLTKILNDKVGTVITSGGNLTNYNPKLQATNPKAEMVGLPNPVLNKGDKVKLSQMDPVYNGYSAAITTACKDVALAERFLDYGYSEAGLKYWNYGTEGTSYTIVNGVPTFKDEIVKYPDGISSAMDKYIGTQWSAPSIQDKNMYLQKTSKSAVAAIDLWASNTDMPKNMMPIVTATAEESQEASKILTAVDTYMKEMYFKFIMGAESLDKYDDYIANLKKLGLDRAIELKQAQLDRYNKR